MHISNYSVNFGKEFKTTDIIDVLTLNPDDIVDRCKRNTIMNRAADIQGAVRINSMEPARAKILEQYPQLKGLGKTIDIEV